MALLAGRYQVIRRLGAGGMGEVFEAADTQAPGGHVAVKVIDASLVGDHGFVERFRREAEAARSIDHPGVVSIHDVASDPVRGPVLVMELLDGSPLDRVLSERRLSAAEAAALGIEVCGVLAAAHAAGIVHRDIKPGNLFVLAERRGEVSIKVLDFGIARAAGARTLTQPGQVFGTPGFASPEQLAAGDGAGARSDLYALAATLFAAMTGAPPDPCPPGGGPISERTMEALDRAGAPPPLARAIAEALAPDPDDRYPSARAMAEALRAALDGGAGATPDNRTPPPSTAPIADTVRPAKARRRPSPGPDAAPFPAPPTGPSRAQRRRRSVLIAALSLAAAGAGVLALRGIFDAGARRAPRSQRASRVIDPATEFVVETGAERTCRAWAHAIAARQHPDGGFSGIRQAPSSGWDTAQQLYVLLAAERACGGGLDARTTTSALRFLREAPKDHGWAGAPTHAGVIQPSTVATAWAVLAFTAAGDGDAAADARDRLSSAQHADGGFALGAGTSPPAESTGYATVMALWALTAAAETLPATRGADAARRAAGAWVRRALAATSSRDASLRGVAGLTEQATWVLWRARAAEDAALAAPLSREILERCAPLVDERFTCTHDPNGDGTVELRLRADADPIRISMFWFPWAALASAELARSPSAALDGPTRAQLASLSRWALGRVAASPDLEMMEAYQLSERLFAASALLAARRGSDPEPRRAP